MNLEGSLSAFGLADVVTLLATTGKSGGLRLHQADRDVHGVVWLVDGAVVAASADTARQGLVRRLVGAGLVDDHALRAAVDKAKAGEKGPARALLDNGAVNHETLVSTATDQILDAVVELVRWPDGTFDFLWNEPIPDDVDVRLTVTELLGQVRGRDEAWAAVAATIPSNDAVLTIPVSVAEDPMLTRDEWAVLALVDGRRTLGDVVELTGAGQFAAASTLSELVRRGLVQVRETNSSDHVGEVQRMLELLAPLESRPTVAAPNPASASANRHDYGRLGSDTRISGNEERPDRELVGAGAPSARYGGGRPMSSYAGAVPVNGSAAPALATDPLSENGTHDGSLAKLIERDPSIDRSMLLRLIAGVRGL